MVTESGKEFADRPLRILVLASAEVIHSRRWTDYLRGCGHQVLLATLEHSGQEESDEKVLPVRKVPGFLRYPLAAPALRKLIKEFRPQLVNAHFATTYGFMAALLPSARPLILSTWGSDILLSPKKSIFHRARVRFALRAAGLVTCDARVVVSALKSLRVPESRILEVPMGIDPGIFHPSRKPPPQDTPIRFISSRRLEPLYDVKSLIQAAALVRVTGLHFTLEVAGDGTCRGELEELAQVFRLEERVSFIGNLTQEELARRLRDSQVYVSCSRSDSTSVSLLEAMASGAFPVVSEIEGNTQWITHGQNGLCFPPGDVGALTECLLTAAQQVELREKARRLNLEIIRDQAVWQVNMSRVERAMRKLAGGTILE